MLEDHGDALSSFSSCLLTEKNQVVGMRRGLVYFKYLGTLCDPTQALAFAAPLILGQDKLSGSSLHSTCGTRHVGRKSP